MEKKRILLDVDEVICFTGFLHAINEFMNTDYVIDDFTDYYLDEVAIPKDRMNEFNNFVSTINLYDYADMLPGAVESIKRLSQYFDIYILSSCINPFDIENSGVLFLNKYKFLLKHLPFISPEKYIFTSSKHLVSGDIIIDDRLSNLKNDIKAKILFPSYHNKDITDEELAKHGVIRAGFDWRKGWEKTESIIMDEYYDKKRYFIK